MTFQFKQESKCLWKQRNGIVNEMNLKELPSLKKKVSDNDTIKSHILWWAEKSKQSWKQPTMVQLSASNHLIF